MVAVCNDVPTDKSPLTDVVGAVIAKVPSVAFDIDSPLPNEISFPVTVRSPAIPIEEFETVALGVIVRCVTISPLVFKSLPKVMSPLSATFNSHISPASSP